MARSGPPPPPRGAQATFPDVEGEQEQPRTRFILRTTTRFGGGVCRGGWARAGHGWPAPAASVLDDWSRRRAHAPRYAAPASHPERHPFLKLAIHEFAPKSVARYASRLARATPAISHAGQTTMALDYIRIRGARTHNLKN